MTGLEPHGVGEVRRQGLHRRLSVKDRLELAPELSLGCRGQSQTCPGSGYARLDLEAWEAESHLFLLSSRGQHSRLTAQIFIGGTLGLLDRLLLMGKKS